MANEVLLQEGKQPLDSYLRPLKIGGEGSCLELTTVGNGARISGDLEVTGSLIGSSDLTDITCDDITCDNIYIKGSVDGQLMSLNGTAINLNSGDIDITAAADLDIQADGDNILFKGSEANNIISFNYGATENEIKIINPALATDFLKIIVGAEGATEIETTDNGGAVGHLTFDIDGDIILDPKSTKIYGQHSGVNTILLDTSVGGVGPSIQLNSLADTGDYFSITTAMLGATTIATVDDGDSGDGVSANLTFNIDGFVDINSAASENITLDAGGDIILDANSGITRFYVAGDADDLCTLTVAANGVTTIATADSDGAVGHLNIIADGHVEFVNCAVGFNQEEATFSHDPLKNTGGTHDTQVNFKIGNKIYLQMTASMDQINLIFPAVSGNFLLHIGYDGDWSIGDWKVWESDLTAASNADVLWPGGTQPDHTDSGKDVFSFYWDAETQICYGVASLAFAVPS